MKFHSRELLVLCKAVQSYYYLCLEVLLTGMIAFIIENNELSVSQTDKVIEETRERKQRCT